MRTRIGPDRVWLLGGALAAVLVVVLAWFAVIGPAVATTGELNDQAVDAQGQNVAQQARVAGLRNDYNDLATLKVELNRVREQLPVGSGLPDLTRQLTQQAAASEIALTSITTGEPLLAGDPADPAAAAAQAGPDPATADGAAPDSATTPDPGDANPDPANPDADAAEPVAQLFAIPVTVVARGRLDGHRAFLGALQIDGPRRALVSSVVFAPGDGSSEGTIDTSTTMTLEMQVFVAPQPA